MKAWTGKVAFCDLGDCTGMFFAKGTFHIDKETGDGVSFLDNSDLLDISDMAEKMYMARTKEEA